MPATLRATFKKGNAMRYTGHLDILRTFIRALRRADMPVKYSEGFNPHAVMTFALALGVGTTSDCEIVDISMNEEIPVDYFISRVNDCMPEDGIKILSAVYTNDKLPNIIRANYIIEYETEKCFDAKQISSKINQGTILVDKKSKRQMKQINLCEHIYDYEIIEKDDTHFSLKITVSAGNSFNIKPQLVTEALCKECADFKPILALPHRISFVFE